MERRLSRRCRAKNEFDMVLMDVQMPVMDGLKATTELRKRGYDLPVIAVSASLNTAVTAQCLQRRAWTLNHKPITRSAVLEVLAKWRGIRQEGNSRAN